MKFGSSGQNIADSNIDFSHFGTKQTSLKRLSFQHMEL